MIGRCADVSRLLVDGRRNERSSENYIPTMHMPEGSVSM